MSETPKLITGWSAILIRRRVLLFIISEAFKFFRNPLVAISEMKKLRDLRKRVHGNIVISKYVKSGNKFFWNTDYCGYPSENLKRAINSEFLKNTGTYINGLNNHPQLQTLIWGITNRCPLSCKHCYEWDLIWRQRQCEIALMQE
jgi:hypothetical protein